MYNSIWEVKDMSYEPTDYDKKWTETTIGGLKIGGIWVSDYYLVQRTKERSIKLVAMKDHERSIEMLGSLIMVCKAIKLDIEHSDVFCCERGRYCENYSYNDGQCCMDQGDYELHKMCPSCNEDYASSVADDETDRMKYESNS
jgi:hypothetical protein